MEDEKRINWLSLFIKMIIIFIFILIIIWLVSKIINRNKLSETFTNNINNMEQVAVDHFKTIDLPLEKGKSKKITLKQMIDKELIVPVNSNNAKKCDTKKSYSKITRQRNNYKVETTLKCGREKDTITRKFTLKDCRNCNYFESDNKKNKTNSNEESNSKEKSQDNSKTTDKSTTNDSVESTNSTNNSSTTSGTTYYEYVKETTSYSNWGKGNITGNNVENKYEYYGIATDTYYTLGYIKANKTETTYTIKLDEVPNSKYYFTTIEESNYFNSSEQGNYLNEDKASLDGIKNYCKDVTDISKYSLGESNFTYKLYPYYRKGSFYVDVTVKVNNTNGVSTYKDSKLNTNVYYIPLKLKVKFASDEITDTKPSGDYETITYYRYVTVNKETKWSTASSLDGYTKTGNTKVE